MKGSESTVWPLWTLNPKRRAPPSTLLAQVDCFAPATSNLNRSSDNFAAQVSTLHWARQFKQNMVKVDGVPFWQAVEALTEGADFPAGYPKDRNMSTLHQRRQLGAKDVNFVRTLTDIGPTENGVRSLLAAR